MKNIKEVQLNIRSVIDDVDGFGLAVGEPEVSESCAVGLVTSEEDKTVISYAESAEGGATVRSEMTLHSQGGVSLKREGDISSFIVFEEGKEHRSVYSVPPYSFDVSVMPKRVTVSVSDSIIQVKLFYLMNIGGQARQVRMTLTANFKPHA